IVQFCIGGICPVAADPSWPQSGLFFVDLRGGGVIIRPGIRGSFLTGEHVRAGLFFAASLWFLLHGAAFAAGAPAESLTIGYSSFSGHYVPLWIAVEDRLGKKYGLDLKAVYAGRARPQPLLMSAENLRGKVIGTGRPGALADTMVRYVLRSKLNLVPDRDVRLLPVGEPALALQSMERGVVDAASFSGPQALMAKKMGFRELVSYDKLGIVYPYNTVTTLRQ